MRSVWSRSRLLLPDDLILCESCCSILPIVIDPVWIFVYICMLTWVMFSLGSIRPLSLPIVVFLISSLGWCNYSFHPVIERLHWRVSRKLSPIFLDLQNKCMTEDWSGSWFVCVKILMFAFCLGPADFYFISTKRIYTYLSSLFPCWYISSSLRK